MLLTPPPRVSSRCSDDTKPPGIASRFAGPRCGSQSRFAGRAGAAAAFHCRRTRGGQARRPLARSPRPRSLIASLARRARTSGRAAARRLTNALSRNDVARRVPLGRFDGVSRSGTTPCVKNNQPIGVSASPRPLPIGVAKTHKTRKLVVDTHSKREKFDL